MIFYLSGGMEFKKNLGIGWREWITGELASLSHGVVNPIKLESTCDTREPLQERLTKLKLENKLEELRNLARHSLFRKDIYGIQISDAIVVYYDEAVQKGAGTISEAWESFREGRPVYLVTDFSLKNLPTWLIAETTEVFKDFESFLFYVSSHNRVSSDVVKARKIRDEILGGIYEGGLIGRPGNIR